MDQTHANQPLWTPPPAYAEGSEINQFRLHLNNSLGLNLADSANLHAFSVDDRERFWVALKDYTGVRAETWGGTVLVDGDRMPGAKWFPEARLNYAENLLRRRDGAEAIVFRSETGARRAVTFAGLYDQVSSLTQFLKARGVRSGDRVVGYLPNMPEAVAAMLAATALGAVWSSCSPDFGVQGVLDRFGQVEPKVVFCTDGYFYNGKRHDVRAKNAEILAGLPTVEQVIVAPYDPADRPDITMIPQAVLLADAAADHAPRDIDFVQVPFDHPLYIMFSSGTTGAPKCMVHCVGGTILKHACEQAIQADIRKDDRVYFFTTCGWMMWNWLVSVLACEACLLLYDGSPFHPGPETIFGYADAENMTLFGTSAKYIDAVAKSGIRPMETHDLSSLRVFVSTGSPLAPEGFEFVYQHIKSDVHLVSFTGGTDIMGIFAGGDATRPVWRGELQTPALGMAVECWDDAGKPMIGQKGELVCTKAFPSMPTGFWGDDDGTRYRAAYFEQFPNVWTHGDYIEITEHGGMIVYGRSDATLNPGGVRIGTAEIYRQVEKLEDVVESLVIGQDWDNDVRVVLFVRLAEGRTLDDAMTKRIKDQVRANCTPRHVPAKVVQVADIPRTKSGKITELAVRDIVHGRPVKNKEAMANPEALKLFQDLAELKT
ncbi:MAG: acetoacetate--CoA ligase [Rhodospirillales bacterium]